MRRRQDVVNSVENIVRGLFAEQGDVAQSLIMMIDDEKEAKQKIIDYGKGAWNQEYHFRDPTRDEDRPETWDQVVEKLKQEVLALDDSNLLKQEQFVFLEDEMAGKTIQ